MAANEFVEVWGGQNLSGGLPERAYVFRDFATADLVDDRLIEAIDDGDIPLSWRGLPLDPTSRRITDLGGKQWGVILQWNAKAGSIIMPGAGSATQQAPQHGGSNGANEPVLYDISYDVGSGTQHITQSIQTLDSKATNHPVTDAARTARNFGRAIGVTLNNGKLEVAGCDVLTGEAVFKRKVLIPAIAFTGAYATVLANLLRDPEHKRACVNDAPFFGFEAGEVLIRTASVGEVDASGYRPAMFEFAVSRNQLEVTISEDPLLRMGNVKGWSHIWVTYEQVTTDGKTRVIPFEAFEEKVYPDGDFSALNLEEYRVAA